MADYFSPTVVDPEIPIADMTPLECLILENVFECESDGDALYFFSTIGPGDSISVERKALLTALEASAMMPGGTETGHIAESLQGEAADDEDDPYIDIDVPTSSWEAILQDIVARSETLTEIVVTTSFSCSKMRRDGFGGAVTLITAERIAGKSTVEMLQDLRAEAVASDMGGQCRSRGDASITPLPVIPNTALATPGATPTAARSELEAALCVWEAMLEFRSDQECGAVATSSIQAMLAVWEELGSVQMRRFAIEIAGLVLLAYEHLRDDITIDLWSFDFEFVPAVVENLDWSIHGPERRDEPELFLAAVLNALRDRAAGT